MTAKKKALCIGINYAGTAAELRGCVNDADDWAGLLRANGFDAAVMVEREATRSALLLGVKTLVNGLGAGDVGVLTYSGHGTWVPDKDGDEPDRKDEALCPIDMGDDGANLILDDELRALFTNLKAGAALVFVSDCCHSGTVYRMLAPGGRTAYRRPRFIPPSHFAHTPAAAVAVDRAFGQPLKTNVALPGVVHFSGCRDVEVACDAEIDGRACGAFSYHATRAFGRAIGAGGTYGQVYADVRKALPSWDFQQTPQFSAPRHLKAAKVLTAG